MGNGKWYSNLIKFCPAPYLPLVAVWFFSVHAASNGHAQRATDLVCGVCPARQTQKTARTCIPAVF
jgi:hypothetical protein